MLWSLRTSLQSQRCHEQTVGYSGNLSGLLTTFAPTYAEEQARDEIQGQGALLTVLPVQVEQGRRKDKEAYIADLKNKRHIQLIA